ncbi:hypothetical protein [Thermomonospora umbrina]|uniref:NIPSNAP protein n=1 Tax=Thermomonospora umbrina TaxID=111806 RepID=A0A3D9SGG6_9ACTN|nr:hypothetical protein [Thermomonospora umbrina]REE94989.1 hypothetical protein DFJ69_0359 [Thermomonospora umbrina]
MPRGIYLIQEIEFPRADTTGQEEPPTRHRREGVDLLGAFAEVGVAGNPPSRAIALWHCEGGWAGGWRRMIDGSPGFGGLGSPRPLGEAPGSPCLADLVAEGYAAPLYLMEIATVRPGCALDYLEAVQKEYAPLLAEHGHRLVGAYEVQFRDDETVTLWGTDADAHVALQRSRDAALGLDDEAVPDHRLLVWRKRALAYLDGSRRERPMSPFPGSKLAP